MSRLDRSMGEMGRISQGIQEETRRINEFFELLRGSSQKAGRFGEFVLEDIVKDIIPEPYRDFQRAIEGRGRVDCLVKLGDRWVPIDAKFSVSALEGAGASLKSAVRGRIDETAKYIAPDQGTTDFVLMFIPSDGLYSQILSESEIVEYALERRVVPVSPTTLYAYLATVALGIRRDEIACKVDQVIRNMKALEGDLMDAFKFLNTAEKQARDSLGNLEKARGTLYALQLKLQKVDTSWEKEEIAEN
jgi:DNA recombination protein RmuC